MKTIDLRFELVEISESELILFYGAGPGKSISSILIPTIFTNNASTYAYIVFPGGITAYVEKSRFRAVIPEDAKLEVMHTVEERRAGISENTLLRAIAIAQDPTLAVELIKD